MKRLREGEQAGEDDGKNGPNGRILNFNLLPLPADQGRLHVDVVRQREYEKKLKEMANGAFPELRSLTINLFRYCSQNKLKKAQLETVMSALEAVKDTLMRIEIDGRFDVPDFTTICGEMRNLTSLSTGGLPWDQRGILNLNNLHRLERLHCSDAYYSTCDWNDLRLNSPPLQELHLFSCNIGDEALSFIAEHSPHLLKLCLLSCKSLTTKTALAIAQYCSQLTEVNFANCHLLTADGVEALADLKSLETLNLQGVSGVTHGISRFCVRYASYRNPLVKTEAPLPSLRKLMLSVCTVTAADLTLVCSTLDALEHLCLNGTQGLVETALRSIAKLPELKCLSLNGLKLPGTKLDEICTSLVNSNKKLNDLDLNNTSVTEKKKAALEEILDSRK